MELPSSARLKSKENKRSSQTSQQEFWSTIHSVIKSQRQAPPIKPISREQKIPLSFAQERLWFIQQLDPQCIAYQSLVSSKLISSLNISALEQSFNQLAKRHETLRTTFPIVDGSPIQAIATHQAFKLPIIDLSQLDEAARKAQIGEYIKAEETQPFDLTKEISWRVKLLHLSETEYVMLLAMHHIIYDGWSRPIFMQELNKLYQACVSKQPPPLTPLTIQYADVAYWQRNWLKGKVIESHLTYWKKQLGGEIPILQLPSDRPRPAIATYQGAVKRFTIATELSKAIKALGKQEGATLFMTLLAVFKTLLYRYTGAQDIIVGTPIANRNRKEIQGIIGFFANTLALRTKFTGEITFRQLLRKVRQIAQEAYTYQDLPFEKLIEELRIERNLNRNPLFDVMFNLVNTPNLAATLSAEEAKFVVSGLGNLPKIAKFDLTLSISETAQGLNCLFQYSSDLFDAATITRMLGHFQTLLQAIVANPEQRLVDLPLVTPSERQQLLTGWNQTVETLPQELCVHKLWEAQVAKTPNEIALQWPKSIAINGDRREITYLELNNRANKLAHYLKKLGVQPESKVGIFLERSPLLIVGLLAILKGGGTYVPLDSTYPRDRLEFMLFDAEVEVLLTQEKLSADLPCHKSNLVFLDSHWESIDRESADNPKNIATLTNLAYIIYTSGSTGKPKGVAMEHRSLSNLIYWQNHRQPLPRKTLQFAPISFDVSLQEIFASLCSGGTLVLTTESIRKDPDALWQILVEEAIERIFLPFIALQQLAEVSARSPIIPTNLQEVITAGEQLQITSAIAKLFTRLSHCRLSNHYGPSETHVATAYTLGDPVTSWSNLPPIGRAIANTQIYILDPQLQPVPIGVSGELYIGGSSLARGYLNRPDSNQEKFIVNPFDNSVRLYKTGDLARYLRDGNIEFLGRIDNQVKIRGYRIEPGEIETILTQHSHIEESIVLVREDCPGDKRLIAYIIPTQEQVPSLEELRGFLRQKLPNYMIPSALVPLEAMPLTPSGKVDRRALAKVNLVRQTAAETYVAPRNSTEQKLAEIWAKILWLDHEVGIYDNFFDLGGHSLLSVRLIAEIEQVFKRKVPLAALFQLGTIAELAKILDQEIVTTAKKSLTSTQVEKHPELSEELYHQLLAYTAGWQGKRVQPNSLIIGLNTKGQAQPLFWCLQGFRELSQLAKYLGADRPTYGMRSGHLLMKYTPDNIKALASHYVAEILTIDPNGPYLLGGNCQSTLIIFEIAQQLQRQGKQITLLCLLERFIPQIYTGRVSLFFGRDSHLNPYKYFQKPELGWHKFYTGELSVDLLPCSHGQYFSEPNIQLLTKKLHSYIEEASLAATPQFLPRRAYQAQMIFPKLTNFATGKSVAIPVTVKNISPVLWQETQISGITLGNHWLDEKGNLIQWSDGRVDLSQDLPPGEEIELSLTVTAPLTEGRYLLELDLVEEGVTWFKQKGSTTTIVPVEVVNAIRSQPENAAVYLGRGNSQFEKGDMARAIISYQKAIAVDPQQSAALYQNLGIALADQENLSAAIVAYKKALELETSNGELYFLLGKAQTKQNNFAEAVTNYQKAIALEPANFWFYQDLALALNRLNQTEEVIKICLEAIKLDPHNPELHCQLGSAQIRSGQTEAGVQSYDMAIALNVNQSANYYKKLGNDHSQQQNFPAARQAYLDSLAINPRQYPVCMALGNTLSRMEQPEEAIAFFQQALELDPKSDKAYNSLGNAQRKQGDLESSINSYYRSLKLNPQQFNVYKVLTTILNQLDRFPEAIAISQEAVTLGPNQPDIYSLLGDAQRKNGDLLAAISSYQKAIVLNPKHPFGIYKNLGDALSKEGKVAEAITAYQSALRLQPNHKAVQQSLASLKHHAT
ncbi:amino acid adenylation enzyme/thioester reductase family protein [Xenococcus sp. PCC 7305]|uniref:non-ribosomal peptide synthetase n=1 Tax=Xenococcus sp. PCC 7305 TaxID=102125 RepID=UPI0002AC8498|nr:non-ribosomal peptide synthetase [Xenococcus sp. PCC 7305]ELS00755.1 amino acid adenylation enzyme/thioester reductase family protein [Xenococcus sp. PCC 7305]